MLEGISNLIGGQLGVNSGQLIEDLVAATRAPRDQQLAQKTQLNQTRISALAAASSALNTFATALNELLDGRGFAGELVSSRSDLASVSFISGKLPEGLPASIEVKQLASAQRLVSGVYASSTTAVGEGTLTLDSAAGSFNIVIDSSNNSLAGLRDAINATASGVTAAILTDKNGSRLVFEGQEGLDNSFTITGSGGSAALDAFAWPQAGGAGMTGIATAQDSIIELDGIELTNSSNNLENVISGVRINLLAQAPGTVFTISGDQPTTTVKTLVEEFVDAYNDLREGLNAAIKPGSLTESGGPLAGNSGIRDMIRALGSMTSTILSSDGPYRTLADIGVKTNNDGTLAIDSTRLDAVLAADPLAVSRMLEPAISSPANPGLAGTMEAIRESLQSESGSLTAAKKRLDDIAEDLTEAREKIDSDIEKYRVQLERSFANMDRQLSILRSTQSYLEQQISIWNNSDN
ncbi:MAG: flagellar filament capping protein FliD [Blastomonas sp.]